MARIKNIKEGGKVYWKPAHYRSRLIEVGHVLKAEAGESEIMRTCGSTIRVPNKDFITEAEAIEHEEARVEMEDYIKKTRRLTVEARQVMGQLSEVLGSRGSCRLDYKFRHYSGGGGDLDYRSVEISTDALIKLVKIAGEIDGAIDAIDIEAIRID